ncbi:unnamed protein product, partial [marine sediment metagenome]
RECGYAIWAAYGAHVNITGFTIQNGTCGVVLWDELSNVYGNVIKDNIHDGIYMEHPECENNVIYGNTIIDNGQNGIHLDGVYDNIISRNNIRGNNLTGISLVFSADDNIISGNNIENNGFDGICLDASNTNIIYGNNITDNRAYGIHTKFKSKNNSIFYNNFINNSINAFIFKSPGSPNDIWHSGYP